MTTLMAGTIILCVTSSGVLRFAPFFLALLAAVVLGAATAVVRGVPLGELPYPSLALLVTGQLAYGFGLFGQAGLTWIGLPRFRPDASRDGSAGPTGLLLSSSNGPEGARSPRCGDVPASPSAAARPAAPPR